MKLREIHCPQVYSKHDTKKQSINTNLWGKDITTTQELNDTYKMKNRKAPEIVGINIKLIMCGGIILKCKYFYHF